MVYGPYIALPRGNYRMEMRLNRSLIPVPTVAGLIDVYSEGATLGSSNLASLFWSGASGTATVNIVFSVSAECSNRVEFRVRVDTLTFPGLGGGGFFGVQSITVFRTS